MKKNNMKMISYALALSFVAQSSVVSAASAEPRTSLNESRRIAGVSNSLSADQQLAVSASLSQSEREMARLLIFNAIIQSQTGNITEISPEIRAKYDSVRVNVLSPITVAIAGGITYYLGAEAAERFQSVLEPITKLVRAMADVLREGLKVSSETSENLMRALKIDKAFDLSANAVEAMADALRPVIAASSGKGVLTLSAFTAAGGSLAVSSFAYMNDTDSALDVNAVRQILGYNKDVAAKIDTIVAELSNIYMINPNKHQVLTERLATEMIRVAVENRKNGNDDAQVDVIAILNEVHAISEDQAAVAKLLSVVGETRAELTLSQADKLVRNLSVIIEMQMVLDQAIANGQLSEQTQKEAAAILVQSQNLLKRVKANTTL